MDLLNLKFGRPAKLLLLAILGFSLVGLLFFLSQTPGYYQAAQEFQREVSLTRAARALVSPTPIPTPIPRPAASPFRFSPSDFFLLIALLAVAFFFLRRRR